jgi:hypothetical protein
MEWGHETVEVLFPKLKIYTRGWVMKEVGVGWRIPDDGSRSTHTSLHSIKYLGCQIDSDNQSEKLFQETLLTIRRMCRTIGSKKASAEVKASAASLRIISMATYRGAAGPWSLERLREWDKPLEALYRKISKCMKSFPTQLLYTDAADQGGLGFPCLSDRIQEEKYARLHRCLVTGGDSGVAADGLLLRGARMCGAPSIRGRRTSLKPVDATYWARSLVEWGSGAGKRLHFGGLDPSGTVDAPVSSILNGDRHQEEKLISLDVITLGDLVEIKESGTGEVRAWLSRRKLTAAGLVDIAPILEDRQVPTGNLTIRVGCCLTLADGEGVVLEFLGWIAERACIRRWTPVKRGKTCTYGTRYMICKEHRSRGAGSDELLEPDALTGPSKRVLMGPDEIVGHRQNKHIERRVVAVIEHGSVNFPSEPPPPSLWSDMAGDFREAGCDLEIYTDASWECKSGTLHDVFMYGDGRYIAGSGGIVITLAGGDWRDAGVRAIRITEGSLIAPSSVFPLELLSTVVAIKISAALDRNCKIYTDCLSVQKLLAQKHLLRSMSRKENLVLLQIGMSDGDKIEKNWIPSHPEEAVKDRSRWSKHMWGNFLADATAAAEWDAQAWGVEVNHIEMSISEVLRTLVNEPMWMWVNSDGSPSTSSIPKDIREARLSKYLADRDTSRVKRGDEPKWIGTQVKFASVQYNLKGVGCGERARRVRIIWDKGWHGGNIAKGKCEIDDTLCALCGEVDGERHWIVGCPHDDCVMIRHEAYGKITDLIEEIDAYDVEAVSLATKIQDWAWDREDGHKIWTGLWSAELIETLDGYLGLGCMPIAKVEHLQGIAMSIGKVLAEATLELWETKTRKGKRTEIGIEKFRRKLAAAALLKRAREKKRRCDRIKADHQKMAEKRKRPDQGRQKEEIKLAFRLATWHGRLEPNMTLNEYTEIYCNTLNCNRGKRGGENRTALSSNLVRGRIS